MAKQTTKFKDLLSNSFIRFSLLPIFIIEFILVILYFSVNYFLMQKSTDLLIRDAKEYSLNVIQSQKDLIAKDLQTIENLAKLLQKQHEYLFKHPVITTKPIFKVAKNGVFYKATKKGASLYYAATTKITKKEKFKALFTEIMDVTFKSIVDTNPNIVAAYFNSYDNMNRIYPYIDKVYNVFGRSMNMQDFNFYYLADKKHNPSKKPVWTDIYYDPAGNGWMVSCVVPIYKGDFLEGVSGLDVTINAIIKNMLSKKLEYNAQLFILNKNAVAIALPKQIQELLNNKSKKFDFFKSNNEFAKNIQKLIKNKLQFFEFNTKGVDYIALHQVVPITKWNLVLFQKEKHPLISK